MKQILIQMAAATITIAITVILLWLAARAKMGKTRRDLTDAYLIGKQGEITEPPHPYTPATDEHGIYHEKK